MKLIIGLGNPDREYADTRHNLGKNVILKLFNDLSLIPNSYPKLGARLAKTNGCLIGTLDCYMNESGIPIQKIISYFKINPSDLYLVHDDLDLAVGEWKLQFDRGPAGHNGVRSVIEHLGTQAFWRYRLGTGHPQNGFAVEDFVLKPFLPQEKVLITPIIDKISGELKNLINS